MVWERANRFDPEVRPLADRHYNRRKVGSNQFAPPGRCIVLKARENGAVVAFWISSWPFAEYVRHQWAGAWICSAFRNESPTKTVRECLSSELIRQAVAVTRHIWGTPPDLGFVSFVNTKKVRSKKHPGQCYLAAGWRHVGWTKGGLLALQLSPDAMPEPEPPMEYSSTELAVNT